MFADPAGAAFGVWQAGEHIGAQMVNEPGAITWEDLRSNDPDASRSFFASLFGYRFDPIGEAMPGYTTFAFADEEAPLGGMGPVLGAEVQPSHWDVYFNVDSTDEAVSRAEAAGGGVLSPALDGPYGRMAALADPAGAAFTVIEADQSRMPDRSG